MPKLGFSPDRHGYHFKNDFVNRILPGVTNGIQTSGLCGGMVMSALDYWRAGVPIPTHRSSDFPGIAVPGELSELPPEASPLRAYIFDRQMNSLMTSWMFTRWITAPWITPQQFHDWAIGSEFDIIRSQIGQGRPAMLGLWSMPGRGGPTQGHQVLAYGWDFNPNRLYVYDPNFPDEECVLTPISAATGVTIVGSTSHRSVPYRGYFFTDVYNWGEQPPYAPRYRDLVVQEGMTIGTASTPANVGSQLSATVTVLNAGDSQASFAQLFIWTRGPNGQNFDPLLGGAQAGRTKLAPGEMVTISRVNNAFGASPGRYTVGVSYLSNNRHWINIPPAHAGASTSRDVTLYNARAQVVDHTFPVPESATDIDTHIDLHPGDEFSIDGSSEIWAGVWGTGLNGPEGWLNWIERNPASPMNNRPGAAPFALIGRFEGEDYFFIGRALSRRPFVGSIARRLFLRTNDDTPGNGSGSFNARVQVWR